MCGIAGYLKRHGGCDPSQSEATLRRMTDRLRHRGPDGDGLWLDDQAGVGFGHRRLAIIDLSPAGRQPMISHNGRYVITFNGEIYNYPELRQELTAVGVSFRGGSDTEVLLEAIAQWGVTETARRANGIFAFAVWDRETRTLALGRDHLGVKPLYWALFDDAFLFGSELKALREHPGWRPALDLDATAAFFRHNYVPGPRTIYQNVYQLPPGAVLILAPERAPEISRYWDMRQAARHGLANRLELSDQEAIDQLEQLLRDAVRQQMMADVPLGVFLSGGVDSSLVTALAQAQSTRPVRSFSIGFDVAAYDEAPYAKAVAQHLGTDHTELYVDSQHALDVIPTLPEMYDEPFADSSQIPTHLVCALTRQHVTVVLSGDGGDELFAGYNRYAYARELSAPSLRLPEALRAPAQKIIRAVGPRRWDLLARLVPGWAPGRERIANLGAKLNRFADSLDVGAQDALYRRLLSHWTEDDNPVLGGNEAKGVLWDASVTEEIPDFIERMQFFDTVTYLPDDILVKVDRASMAVALEARVPLLDPRVVEFAWRLPPRFKIRDGQTKWGLRQTLYRHVPAALIDRPKMGFGAPIGEWMRGPLRDWCEHLLDQRRLSEAGILDPQLIQQRWRQHLSGEINWQYPLWDVLMFESWRERWLTQTPGPGSEAA